MFVAAEDAVFVDLESEFFGAVAKFDIMFFGAGKVLHRGAEGFFRNNSQIKFHTGLQTHSLFGFAALKNGFDERVSRESIHGDGGIVGDSENIKVAAGFTASAAAAGGFAGGDFGELSQIINDGFCSRASIGDRDAGDVFSGHADVLQNRGFCFGAEALDFGDLTGFAGRFELVECGESELLEEDGCLFGADAGNTEHVEYARRDLLFEFLEARVLSGGDNLLNLSGEVSADAGKFREIAACGDGVSECFGESGDGAGGVAIGANTKWVGALNFKEISQKFKLRSDGVVVHGGVFCSFR